MSELVRLKVTAAKRLNERLILASHTLNALVLSTLMTAILVPIIENRTFESTLTEFNAVILAWSVVLHFFAHVILGYCVSEEP